MKNFENSDSHIHKWEKWECWMLVETWIFGQIDWFFFSLSLLPLYFLISLSCSLTCLLFFLSGASVITSTLFSRTTSSVVVVSSIILDSSFDFSSSIDACFNVSLLSNTFEGFSYNGSCLTTSLLWLSLEHSYLVTLDSCFLDSLLWFSFAYFLVSVVSLAELQGWFWNFLQLSQ